MDALDRPIFYLGVTAGGTFGLCCFSVRSGLLIYTRIYFILLSLFYDVALVSGPVKFNDVTVTAMDNTKFNASISQLT
jgi:hypothetical protein